MDSLDHAIIIYLRYGCKGGSEVVAICVAHLYWRLRVVLLRHDGIIRFDIITFLPSVSVSLIFDPVTESWTIFLPQPQNLRFLGVRMGNVSTGSLDGVSAQTICNPPQSALYWSALILSTVLDRGKKGCLKFPTVHQAVLLWVEVVQIICINDLI